MCRLFGVVAQDPLTASYYLRHAEQSLLVQSHIDAKHKQGDGWGIGWFKGGRPRIFKSPEPIYKNLTASLTLHPLPSREREGVRDGLPPLRSHVLLGHVRLASNPM